MNRRWALALLLVAGVAVALRAPELSRRPMHGDEAVNTIKFRALWEKGNYVYDPSEFHGPTLAYSSLAAAGLTPSHDFVQFTETTFRCIPLVFGVGLILLLPLLTDGLGRAETLCAAILTAVSPAMVFYSRYYIHEMLLVFFSALLLAASWRFHQSRRFGWCLLAGASLGFMHATKETFVFSVGALALALACTALWSRLEHGRFPDCGPWLNARYWGPALGLAVAVSLLLFSSFFTNLTGPLDSFRTYLPWLSRAAGNSPHGHPWFFYLHRLILFHSGNGPWWTEGVILVLAGAGFVAAFTGRGLGNLAFCRLLAFYTLFLTLAYCLIPYKTPWCLLGFLHGMILLAGVGAMAILRALPQSWARILVSSALVLAVGHLGWQAWQASYTYCADRSNPYVYAHTSPDVINLVDKVQALGRCDSRGNSMMIKVMAADGDYWPLPWYLRQFRSVGWWDKIPSAPLAPVMIVSAKFQAAFDERPEKTHLMVGYFQLRPQVFLELYVELNLWRAYLHSLPPKAD